LKRSNRTLQPWRYLTEVSGQLARLGHAVTILTDGIRAEAASLREIDGVPIRQLRSVRCFAWKENAELARAFSELDPQVILWSIGLTSFLHQQYPERSARAQVGIFSSPIYSPGELTRLGLDNLARNYALSGVALLGALSPRGYLRKRASQFKLNCLVTQTETTRQRLLEQVWCGRVETIPPSVDDIWYGQRTERSDVRPRFGFKSSDFILVYFGPPARLRGLPILLRAVAEARKKRPEIKLVILNRRREGEFRTETSEIQALVERLGLEKSTYVSDNFLDPPALVEMCAAGDAVVLPFELIPSDAPLSVLEARTLGKPLVTTRLGCVPELAGSEQVYLCEPGNISSLARALLAAVGEAGTRDAGMEKPKTRPPAHSWKDVGLEWSKLIQSL
jgi:glycosyltransferase involved in cell wall biosynthesis